LPRLSRIIEALRNERRSESMGQTVLSPGEKILFIGDSITDCGRAGGPQKGPDPLGEGYVRFFADILCGAQPELEVECVNKGISGNTITDLAGRWGRDALSEKPGRLSVMIGINDIHRHLRGEESGMPPEKFRQEYDALLDRTIKELQCRLVILDPFYISADGGGDPLRKKVVELLPEYLAVTAGMAEKYGAVHIRLHEAFRRHLKYRPAEVFCPEPVHPNRTGHMVIAWELFRALRAK
jgi:lysophospholipase L1-like esterase